MPKIKPVFIVFFIALLLSFTGINNLFTGFVRSSFANEQDIKAKAEQSLGIDRKQFSFKDIVSFQNNISADQLSLKINRVKPSLPHSSIDDENNVEYIELFPNIADEENSAKVVFVHHTAKAYSEPSLHSKPVVEYEDGTQLNVVYEINDWYAIEVRADKHLHNIEFIDDQQVLIDAQGMMTVFIQKKDTRTLETLRLNAKKLIQTSYLKNSESHQSLNNSKLLNAGYIFIEPISKEVYDSKRYSAVNFLSKTSNLVEDKNGVLTINLPNSYEKVVLKDNVVDNDGTEEFSYIGYIDHLNQHLVLGSYWERYDYTYYDMASGKTTQKFDDYPFISPDVKYIITLYANPYEMTTEFELYAIEKNENNTPNIHLIMSVDFINWMPTFDHENIFWSTDGYLYIPVNHVREVWNKEGRYNDTFQYARIKVDI